MIDEFETYLVRVVEDANRRIDAAHDRANNLEIGHAARRLDVARNDLLDVL
jgi:hypothetical protein